MYFTGRWRRFRIDVEKYMIRLRLNLNIVRLALFFLTLTCLASSCAFPTSISRSRMIYAGRFYPPSMRVSVVYDERDLKTTRYEFIGEIAWTSTLFKTDEYNLLEQELIAEAQSRGADAMIVSIVPFMDSSSVRHTLRVRLVKYIL
jgi:hypothetical protein